MNPNKVDLQTGRTTQQWQVLLDTVKRNDDSVLTKIEQSYYIEQLEFKLGIRNKHLEVLKEIEAGMADIDDLK